jgi:hypothetical protein
MPILLLARGDAAARDLLKKAISARYGVRPPTIETLRIDFEGRTRVKIGPLKTWVPVEVTSQFGLPSSMRWDFTARPAGVPMRRGVESFDGVVMRTVRGTGPAKAIEDVAVVETAKKRLWAIAALMLTPLGDEYVELKLLDEFTFQATNIKLNVDVTIKLYDNFLIESVSVEAFNSDSGKNDRLSLSPSADMVTMDDLLLPAKIVSMWGGEPWLEVHPKDARHNPDIPIGVFMLDAGAIVI